MASRKLSRLASGVTDASVYGSTHSQELTSILNAPDTSTASTWLAWPFSSASSATEAPPPLPPGTLPEVRIEDFARYLRKVGDRFDNLEQERAATEEHVRRKVSFTSDELKSSQGQGLVAALREVPAVFFQESFELDRPEVWGLLGDVQSDEGRQEALEKLGHYLDVVETHLVREIAARSDNFFDASGYIQDLQRMVFAMHQEVAELHAKMSQLEQESGAAVLTSHQLQQQRERVLAALETLKAVEEVAQAQAALQGLLPQAAGGGGVAADFVGAIDVLEVLQGVLDNQDLLALDCFKTLPQQIGETAQAVDDLMATDFLERVRFAGEGAATDRILQRLEAQLATMQTPRGGAAQPRARLSSTGSSGSSSGVEAVAGVRLADPAALERVAAWVAEAVAGGEAEPAAGLADGGGEELQDVLLPLVMGMRRMGRLSVSLKDYQEASSAGVRDLLRRVVDECLAVLAPGPSDSQHLVAGRAGSPPPRPSASELLQQLPGEHFLWVLEAVLLASRACLDHVTRVATVVEAVLLAAKAPRQQVTAAVAECREVYQAVADVAVGRFAKLLSGRAHAGAPAAPRLNELREAIDLTDVVASLAEGAGTKAVLAVRSALQQMCKASLDALHSKSLGKLTTLLEQEHWSLVEVPAQFQHIVEKLLSKAHQAEEPHPPRKKLHNGRGKSDDAVLATSTTSEAAAEAAMSPILSNGAASPAEPAEAASAAPDARDGVPGSHAPGEAQQQQHEPDGGERSVLRKFTITPQVEPGGRQQRPLDVLVVGSQRYHVVNTALLLLSMLGEYLAFRDSVPGFAAEVAQRVLELLKIFNSRTCQLVLGAGAMQVSGLKSITAKHLAISCQCLDLFIGLHPALTAVFTHTVPQPRKDLLVADFTRADYMIHRDEICSKLVFIMRERLSMNLKQLPATAAAWPSGPAPPQQQQQAAGGPGGAGATHPGGLPGPSGFAATNIKQLHILSGVLTPLLLPEETHSIFSRVALMFSSTLAEAFGLLEARGPAWERQLQADVLAVLGCLEQLPMESDQREASLERLRLFYKQRFEKVGPPAEQQPQQQQDQPESPPHQPVRRTDALRYPAEVPHLQPTPDVLPEPAQEQQQPHRQQPRVSPEPAEGQEQIDEVGQSAVQDHDGAGGGQPAAILAPEREGRNASPDPSEAQVRSQADPAHAAEQPPANPLAHPLQPQQGSSSQRESGSPDAGATVPLNRHDSDAASNGSWASPSAPGLAEAQTDQQHALEQPAAGGELPSWPAADGGGDLAASPGSATEASELDGQLGSATERAPEQWERLQEAAHPLELHVPDGEHSTADGGSGQEPLSGVVLPVTDPGSQSASPDSVPSLQSTGPEASPPGVELLDGELRHPLEAGEQPVS
ncbi:hypothetical protein N2152v2_005885 [Parachlorella kessleri]